MYCLKCGSELLEGAVFCSRCGARVEEQKMEVTKTRTGQHINRPMACIAMVFALLAVPGFFMVYYGNTFNELIQSYNILTPIGSIIVFLICFLSMLDLRAGAAACALLVILNIVSAVLYYKTLIVSFPASYLRETLPILILPIILEMIMCVLLLISLSLKSIARRILVIACSCMLIFFMVSNVLTIRNQGLPTGFYGAQWNPIRVLLEYLALLIVTIAVAVLPVRRDNEVI